MEDEGQVGPTGWKAIGPRVSEHYKLGLHQDRLDFVDVDLLGDDPLFVDAFLLRTSRRRTCWSRGVQLLQDYFRELLTTPKVGPRQRVVDLLAGLHEPNETHLGYSRRLARGHAIGDELGNQVGDALLQSRALETGLLRVEDTVLMVPGVGKDLISDLTTNIVRGPLVDYTHDIAGAFDLEMSAVVVRIWDRKGHRWESVRTELPCPDVGRGQRPLLLVPKSIVRVELTFKAREYFRHYMLPHLQQIELNANSEMVRLLKDGTRWVAKKDLISNTARASRSSPASLPASHRSWICTGSTSGMSRSARDSE